MLTKSASILQTSGQVTAVDAKFKKVKQLLTDDSPPSVQLVEGIRSLVNRDDERVFRLLEVVSEAIDLLEQAIEVWSRPSRSHNKVGGWRVVYPV